MAGLLCVIVAACFTAQAAFSLEGEKHEVTSRHLPKLARPLPSRQHRLDSQTPASGETDKWTGIHQTVSPPLSITARNSIETDKWTGISQTVSPPLSITTRNSGSHDQSYPVHSPDVTQYVKTFPLNTFLPLLHHAHQLSTSSPVSGSETVRQMTSPVNVRVESSPKQSPGVTQRSKTVPSNAFAALLHHFSSVTRAYQPSTPSPISGHEMVRQMTSPANVRAESSPEQSHVPTVDDKTRPLKTFTALLHSTSPVPLVSQSSTNTLISGNGVVRQLTRPADVQSSSEYLYGPTHDDKTKQDKTKQNYKAKQDDKPHQLQTFPALLLLVAIVTLVGLVHFKVCAEVKRCWESGGLSDRWRSSGCAVAHKLKLVLRPLYCRQESDKGFPESSTTSLLTRVSYQNV